MGNASVEQVSCQVVLSNGWAARSVNQVKFIVSFSVFCTRSLLTDDLVSYNSFFILMRH